MKKRKYILIYNVYAEKDTIHACCIDIHFLLIIISFVKIKKEGRGCNF